MLCTVVKHLRSGDSTQEVGTLLSCYRRFLRALQQNRARSRPLYCPRRVLAQVVSVGVIKCPQVVSVGVITFPVRRLVNDDAR